MFEDECHGKSCHNRFYEKKKKRFLKPYSEFVWNSTKEETWELFEKENLEDSGPPWKCGWDDRLQWNAGFQDSWCARKIVHVQRVSYRSASADGCLLRAPRAWPLKSRMFTILLFLLFLLILMNSGEGENKNKRKSKQKLYHGKCWKKEMPHSSPPPPPGPKKGLCFTCWKLPLRILPQTTLLWLFPSAAASSWYNCQGGVLLCLIKGCY